MNKFNVGDIIMDDEQQDGIKWEIPTFFLVSEVEETTYTLITLNANEYTAIAPIDQEALSNKSPQSYVERWCKKVS